MSAKEASGLIKSLHRWVFHAARFNRYGLYRDDCLDEGLPEVREALLRIPEETINGRNFRLIRAMHYSMNKEYLPKDQWIKYEDDVHYLFPIVVQILKEKAKREEWLQEN